MSAIKPPVANGGATAPGLVCSRWLVDHPCGQPAVVHVAWDEELTNGLVCEEHAGELGTVWAYLDKHAYNPMCSIPGAVWHFTDPSYCDVPDLHVVAKSVERELVAP